MILSLVSIYRIIKNLVPEVGLLLQGVHVAGLKDTGAAGQRSVTFVVHSRT